MKANEALAYMLETSGRSAYSVSLALGKSHSYINSLTKRKGNISAHVLASVANVLDYDLALINRQTGETILLDACQDDLGNRED